MPPSPFDLLHGQESGDLEEVVIGELLEVELLLDCLLA